MKNVMVSELALPLSDYATVSEDAPLFEAIQALEKAQAEFNQTRYAHRAILVYDKSNKIVGKLSQMDVIKALEPDYEKNIDKDALSRFGISDNFLQSSILKHDFWNMPLDKMCSRAGRVKVRNVMYKPTELEYVEETATLQEAIHRMIVGHHHSLLVTKGGEIVGILRLSDIFASVEDTMKELFSD
jgi:CBS domain-containing protein